ncbi:hypothetical protein EPA93_45970 [Ktedonosporobacter rubrisoli]|uniref:Non-ribosomal peptide synthetase n=1 Tax=Ktedonosporobacter rubrisoli TaxID=2509675 RepID=A0A4P6K4R9_KTERU|nr:condensation domain-containing protein [Ktedonosporobacter rubrisoli]QBD82923.1 hypothetical protein EPA93_45970 [Ktedonosporobacter rubrisoli]
MTLSHSSSESTNIQPEKPDETEQEESYLFAASFAQERLWFLHRFEPESSAYHLFLAFELDGQFQPAAFEESLNDLLARHESLRTSFVLQGEQLMQRIHAQLWLSLSQQHLSLPAESESNLSQQALQAWLQQEIRRPFDLQQAPLLRASLLHRGSEPSILLLCLHHIIADGWSLGILLQELSLCYNAHVKGISPQLAPLPLQYADYAVWQRAWLQEERQEKLQRYWHGQLATAPALLDLPTDHPRPPIQTFVGARHQLHLPAELLEQLVALSHQQQVTLYMTLLAAFLLLLYRYSGQEDLVVGTPIAGRQRRELEGVIGLFANTLVLRTDLSGDPSFLELLQRVREVTLQAYSQQDMPFEKLVAELQPERSLAYNPLFQVFFSLDNTLERQIIFHNTKLKFINLPAETAKFDLSWTWYLSDTRSLSAVIEYNTALFEAKTITNMATNMLVVLQSLCQEPRTPVSLLPLLSAAQRLHLLSLGHSSSPLLAAPSYGLHHLIEAQCERSSLQPALHAGSTTLTYRQLNQQANQLAHLLRQHGIGPGCLVGLCLHRSPSLLLCLLAILKTGAAYVPLDPDYPSQRLLWMAQDAQLSLLLTHEELKARWPHCPCPLLCLDTLQERYASLPCEDLQEACSPAQLAYVLYTSGSTGRPKGVQISHGALLSFLLSLQSLLSLSPHDRWLAITSISFDIAGLELYLPLLAGAQIQLASQEQASDPRQLASLLAQLPISILQATPTTWQLLLETGWSGKAGLTLLSGAKPSLLISLAACCPVAKPSGTSTVPPRPPSGLPPSVSSPLPSSSTSRLADLWPTRRSMSSMLSSIPNLLASPASSTSGERPWLMATWLNPASVPNASCPIPSAPSPALASTAAAISPPGRPMAACATISVVIVRSSSTAIASNWGRLSTSCSSKIASCKPSSSCARSSWWPMCAARNPSSPLSSAAS